MVTFPVLVKLLDVSFICHVQNLYIPWPFFRFPSLVSILSLNPYYAWERLGTLGNAWDACDLAARRRQSRKAVWVVAATSCFQSPTFPNTQHGCQKSDTCAKLPEIFEAK